MDFSSKIIQRFCLVSLLPAVLAACGGSGSTSLPPQLLAATTATNTSLPPQSVAATSAAASDYRTKMPGAVSRRRLQATGTGYDPFGSTMPGTIPAGLPATAGGSRPRRAMPRHRTDRLSKLSRFATRSLVVTRRLAASARPGEVDPVRRQGRAQTVESTALSSHIGSLSDPI